MNLSEDERVTFLIKSIEVMLADEVLILNLGRLERAGHTMTLSANAGDRQPAAGPRYCEGPLFSNWSVLSRPSTTGGDDPSDHDGGGGPSPYRGSGPGPYHGPSLHGRLKMV